MKGIFIKEIITKESKCLPCLDGFRVDEEEKVSNIELCEREGLPLLNVGDHFDFDGHEYRIGKRIFCDEAVKYKTFETAHIEGSYERAYTEWKTKKKRYRHTPSF